MDDIKYLGDLKDLQVRVKTQNLYIGGLLTGLVLSLLIIFHIIGSERTVVTPPNLAKSFWVEQDRLSNNYLEQFGGYVAWLVLDVTPTTIDWKKDALLKYVAPESHGEIKIRQDVEAERLKKLNASTYFLIQQLSPDEEKQSVMLTGMLRTQVNGVTTSTVQKSYIEQFHYKGGVIHLKEFRELPNGK